MHRSSLWLCHLMVFSLCVSLLKRALVIGFRAHPKLGPSHLGLITLEKTLFPSKVTVTRSGWHEFWGGLANPVHRLFKILALFLFWTWAFSSVKWDDDIYLFRLLWRFSEMIQHRKSPCMMCCKQKVFNQYKKSSFSSLVANVCEEPLYTFKKYIYF